jgi:hypothetical protein
MGFNSELKGLIVYIQHNPPLHTCKVIYFLTLSKQSFRSVKLEILHSLTGLYKNPTEQLIGLKICLVAYVPVYFCQTGSYLV